MTTNQETPISIDYTNRDFYSLRSELVTRIQNRIQGWSGNDGNDFGLALIEAFAYMGDVISYYTDRVAHENNITTASQRASVISLAKTYGYNPAGYQAATTTISFSNSSASAVTIPQFTQLSGKIVDGDTVRQIIFTLTAAVTVPANGQATGPAIHGYFARFKSGNEAVGVNDIAGELIGTGTGQPGQTYTLSENSVVDGSIRIYVQNGNAFGEFKPVLHLADYRPADAVVTTETDENNYVSVIFGDGVSGAIPPIYSQIKADYLIGGGVIGNVPINTLTTLHVVPGLTAEQKALLESVLTVRNTVAATGGVDVDDLATIKKMATESFSSNLRAVTVRDYSSLAVQVPSVGKAFSVSDTGSSVTLYVAPKRVSTATDPYPLYDGTNTTLTAEWNDGAGGGLQPTVQNELATKIQIGVSLTVSPPTYVPVTLSILYNKRPQYTTVQAEAQIKDLLNLYYSYRLVQFGQTIYPEDIEFVLKYAGALSNATVVGLYRSSETAGRKVLVGQRDEIFIFNPTAATLTQASSISTLSTLSTNQGTLSPVFSSTFYNYSLVIGTAITSVAFTPTKTDAGATIYVNGNLTTSGSAATINTSTASITAISGSGSVVTYTAANTYAAGQVVTITGATTAGYNLVNAVITSATSSQFTVASTATGATSTATATPKMSVDVRVVAQDLISSTTYSVVITKA